MTGPFDHLHIKGRTAGSSNELSFDVLDAARSDIDAKRPRGSRKSSAPKPSQGNYHGVAGTSTLSAVPEVERRKRARRKRSIRLWILAAGSIAVLVAVSAYFGYRFYQERVDFSGRFELLVEQFIDIDRTLVEVDSLMADPLNSVEADEREGVLERFEDANSALEAVVADARSMQDDPMAPSDGIELSEVESAARAREDMLAAAADAFKLSEIVNDQVNVANEAWSKVLAGDSAAREATAVANSATTESATIDARGKTESAIELMSQARKELVLLAREVRNVDFAAETTYIDKRLEALDAALATADALLAGNRTAAGESNVSYNAADAAAVALASDLPASIGDQIKFQYIDEMQRLTDVYSTARSQVSIADAALRAHL